MLLQFLSLSQQSEDGQRDANDGNAGGIGSKEAFIPRYIHKSRGFLFVPYDFGQDQRYMAASWRAKAGSSIRNLRKDPYDRVISKVPLHN